MVVPRESAHFGFYAAGQDKEVVPMNETKIYTEDYIGLKTLDEAGKIAFLVSEGDHLQFSIQWLIDNVIDVYLK